jgi:hypothetical protein
LSSDTCSLEEYLAELNERFAPWEDFFQSLTDEGGDVEYFVGWFGTENIGVIFSPRLMETTSKLSVALALDVYPYR